MALPWTFNDSSLYGQIIKRNKPIPGIEVALKKEGSSVDVNVTDANGNWSFDITLAGFYDVIFYGGGLVEDDWILNIELVPDVSTTLAGSPLVYTTDPVIIVSESGSRVDTNGNETSIINLSFNNLIPDSGTLTRLEVFYKKSDEAEYKPLKAFPVAEEVDTVVFQAEIFLDYKPVTYDFKALFMDILNLPYKVVDTVFTAEALNVILDGVPDVNEYIGVQDVEPLNTLSDSGSLESNHIKLQWTDLKNIAMQGIVLGTDPFPIESKDAFGRLYSITREVAAKIENYVIFMFVADEDVKPQKRHPGMVAAFGIPTFSQTPWAFKGDYKNDPNGIWVFMGNSTTPNFATNVPKKKYVGFWVGFRTLKTVSSITHEKMIY